MQELGLDLGVLQDFSKVVATILARPESMSHDEPEAMYLESNK